MLFIFVSLYIFTRDSKIQRIEYSFKSFTNNIPNEHSELNKQIHICNRFIWKQVNMKWSFEFW